MKPDQVGQGERGHGERAVGNEKKDNEKPVEPPHHFFFSRSAFTGGWGILAASNSTMGGAFEAV
jgi:hypothetical protein